MKKEDEDLFSQQLNEMADTFNKVSITSSPIQPSTGLPKEAAEYNGFALKTAAAFKEAGYSDEDWKDLLQRSGAAKKLGLDEASNKPMPYKTLVRNFFRLVW